MKLKIVKKADTKKKDARPQIRIKAAGNVFVEVYKDGKGYFYRIDVPGATDFVSKERFENQDKARRAGETHAKKFVSKIRGDQKKADADADTIISGCTKNAASAEQQLFQLKKTFHKDAIAVTGIFKSADSFDDRKYKNMRGTITEVRFQCQELLDVINNYEDDIDKAYRKISGACNENSQGQMQ